MRNNKPFVSIGLPVFNGEKYLAETLNSLLCQTYSNFELIISDNASTDNTPKICLKYAARDSRIRYFRNKSNIGASKNFNQVFALSSGEYFKWAAHDDICAPDYLERCVELLSLHPSVTICHPRTSIINEHGRYLGDWIDCLNFRSEGPSKRFSNYLFRPFGMWNAIFGVIRVSELKKTPLFGSYISPDKVLLGELVLRGKVYQIPENLFFRRRHPQQSWRANPTRKELAIWIDPANRGKIPLPLTWKHFFEYLRAIWRVRMPWYEQTWSYLYLTKWLCKKMARPFMRIWRKPVMKRINDSSLWIIEKKSRTKVNF